MSLSNPLQVPNGHAVHFHKAVVRFMEALPPTAWAYSVRVFETLSDVGLAREFKQLRHVRDNLWELRVDSPKPNRQFMRYLFVTRNGKFLVTHAYFKQTNKAPRQEIELAIRRVNE
jgi:phage-related protein